MNQKILNGVHATFKKENKKINRWREREIDR
jgi:hypothetical protein